MKHKEISLHYVPCNLCGSEKYEILFSRKDLNTQIPGTFTVVCCKECGLVFQNPRPTRDSIKKDIYPDEYDQYLETTKHSRLIDWFQNYGFRKRLRFIKQYKKSGNLIDVGCASGDFLKFVQSHSDWRIFGVEPVTTAANLAHEKLGIEIYNTDLTEANLSNHFFDVVTFWHVFEHLEDPRMTLSEVHRILKDDGLLVITVPIMNCLDHHLFKEYWIGFELPRHFYFFTKESLAEYLQKAGFKILNMRCLYGSHAMTITSLKFWLLGKVKINKNLIKIIITILMSYPIRILLSPIFFILDKFQLSTPMTIIAKKCRN